MTEHGFDLIAAVAEHERRVHRERRRAERRRALNAIARLLAWK